KTCSVMLMISFRLIGRHRANRPAVRFQDKLGITQCSHFWDIETFQFVFSRNTLTDDDFDQPVHCIGEWENETKQCSDTDQLGYKLTGVSIEQSTYAIGAVSEKTYRENAEQSTCAVDGSSTDGIIDTQHAIDKFNTHANQQATDKANDAGITSVDVTTRSRDGNQPGKQAVACHGCVRLPILDPHIDDRGKRARTTSQHRIYCNGADPQSA